MSAIALGWYGVRLSHPREWVPVYYDGFRWLGSHMTDEGVRPGDVYDNRPEGGGMRGYIVDEKGVYARAFLRSADTDIGYTSLRELLRDMPADVKRVYALAALDNPTTPLTDNAAWKVRARRVAGTSASK